MESDENPLDGYWLEGDSLAPPCQAEMDVVKAIIDLADLNATSVLFDLGCGDGRICLEASKSFQCRSVGCEIEEKLITAFQKSVADAHLEDKVTIVHGDLLELDLSQATVIVLYLLPEAVELIKPKLIDCLLRGVTVICNTWGPKPLPPSQTVHCGFCNNVTLLKYDLSSVQSLRSA